MSFRYHLVQLLIEHVKPGYSLAIPTDTGWRLFQVERVQMSHEASQPVMFTLSSEPINGGDPWVLEYEAGTPVIRILGTYEVAS